MACHLLTINVGLGSGGKAQHFAQTMAIANVQKQIVAAGKINLVGDREFYNTAAELTRIMGHKNPDQFFNDPTAVNPQTGQLLNPPSAPPSLPPDPKLLVVQAKAQSDQAIAAHLKAAAKARKTQRSPVPSARKARDGHHYVPQAESNRQIPDDRSSCLVFRWSRSTINPISETFPLFRSTTIRSAPMA